MIYWYDQPNIYLILRSKYIRFVEPCFIRFYRYFWKSYFFQSRVLSDHMNLVLTKDQVFVTWALGCPSLLKSQKMSRLIKDPIYLDIIIGNLKGQSIPTSSSIRIFTLKYTKEILKNTKEKSGNRIFQFLVLNTIL